MTQKESMRTHPLSDERDDIERWKIRKDHELGEFASRKRSDDLRDES